MSTINEFSATNEELNNLEAMSEKDFANSVNLATTEDERARLDEIFEEGKVELTVNIVKGKSVKEETILLYLNNYRKNNWKSAEFDDLRNSMRRVGQKERAVVMKVKGAEPNAYFNDSGNHRLGAYLLNGTEEPFRVEVDIETVTLDRVGIARAHLNQAMSNKRVKADTKSMLNTVVEAFKAGVPVAEIARKTGYTAPHIQSLLHISNDSKEVLAVLGFDLRTNPFTPAQLKKLVPLARFVQREIWDTVLEEEGKKSAPAKFISRLERLAEEEAEERAKREREEASDAGAVVTPSGEQGKEVTITKTVASDDGKSEQVTETIIVEKNELVVDCKDVKALYTSLVSLSEEYTEFKALIEEYFTVQ